MNDTVAAVPNLTRALPALGQVNAKLNGTPLLDHLADRLRAPEQTLLQRWLIFFKLDHLARLLRDSERGVSGVAAEAVGGLGSAAATPEFLAHLARLLRDSERDVRRVAAEAVEELMAQDVRIFKLSRLLRKKWEGRSVAELSQ